MIGVSEVTMSIMLEKRSCAVLKKSITACLGCNFCGLCVCISLVPYWRLSSNEAPLYKWMLMMD